MQTILGANGVIGRALSRELSAYTDRIRQVSRTPTRVDPTDDLCSADLLDAKATADAVAGSSVAYLVAGLKYDYRVWQEQWPTVMRNAIDGCKRHGSALVFFDNVYAYGRVEGVMTEETPYNPCSRKGEVRARIATKWVGNPNAIHTFTYTPDAGRTVALLGNSVTAYGQVWHALTSHEPMTGEDYVRMACELSGRPYGLQVPPRWMLSLLGAFVPALRENMEMLYQLEHDYRFDSTKIKRAFGLTATAYREGISATVRD